MFLILNWHKTYGNEDYKILISTNKDAVVIVNAIVLIPFASLRLIDTHLKNYIFFFEIFLLYQDGKWELKMQTCKIMYEICLEMCMLVYAIMFIIPKAKCRCYSI